MPSVPGLPLLICRTRAHQRARLREVDVRAWTFPDLKERLCAWSSLKDGTARDDLGARLMAAAALAGDGPLLPRLGPALDALRQEFIHAMPGETRGRARLLLDALGDDDADNEQGRAREVRRLLERVRSVEHALGVRGVVDDALALDRARFWLLQGARPRFLVGVSRVVFEDLVEASALEVAVVHALAKHLPVTVRLPVDDVAGRGALAGIDAVYRAVEADPDSGGGGGGAVIDAVSVVGDGALAEFRAALFGNDEVAGANVAVRLVADAAAEAGFVAGVVSAWRQASPQASVAVAVRDERQVMHFIDALRLQGLPVRRRRRALIESPAARLLVDLLALRTDGAPRERLMSVLLSPARKNAISTDAGARLLSTLRAAAARRDVEDQTRPAGGYRHRLQRLVDRDPERAADVAFVLQAIEPVLALAARLPRAASLGAHMQAVLRVVREVVDETGSLGAAEVLEMTARLASGCARVGLQDSPGVEVGEPDGAGDGTNVAASQIELPALLRLIERELQTQPWLDDDVDVDDGAVEVLSVPELVGRRFDHVAIARVVEGELPQPPPRSGLLGDTDRARLNRLLGKKVLRLNDEDRLGSSSTSSESSESSPQATSTGQEGLWWLTALGAATHSLLLTAPRVDVRGREHAPSAFLLDAARVLGATPDQLMQQGRCGAEIVADEGRRSLLTRLTRLQLAGATHGDALGTVAHQAQVELFSRMVRERARWWRDKDGAYADRRNAFAFAVDKGRVARFFGDSFGLSEKKPLTPTRLEALAECRMHGFVQQVLKLNVDVEPGNAIEARVQGTLAHGVLERFFTERRALRVPLSRMNREDRARLAALVDAEAAPLLAGKTTGHLAALSAAIEFLKRTLLRVTMTLARRPPVEGVEPIGFEVQIGARTRHKAPEHPSVLLRVDDTRTIWLGGIIDRVDEGPGGRAVVDYKTMSSSRVKQKASTQTLLQTHFQLLVYLRLLESVRPTNEVVALHGHLVSLKDGGTSKDVAELPDLRARVMDDSRDDGLGRSVGRVILPILDGTLPPDANDRCADCRLQRVCRVPQEGVYATDPDEAEEESA